MKFLLSPLLAIITIIISVFITYQNPVLLQNIELKYFDYLLVDKSKQASDIVLIDISDKTLKKYGQFPLPRNDYADLIEKLRKSNAGAIVFNMSFPEQDRTGQDDRFVSLLNQGVVLSHFPSNQVNGKGAYTTGIVEVGESALPFIPSYPGIVPNISNYEDAASGIGIANTIPEVDGVVRRLPMISAVDQTMYPSIVLEVLKIYTDTNTYQIKTDINGIEAVRVKGFPMINTDPNSRIWINPNMNFTRYDMVDDIPDLNGATVFVGVTAEGISNPVPTPNGAKFGHEIIASAFSSVIDNYNISQPAYTEIFKIILTLLFGLLIIGLSYTRYGWIILLASFVGFVFAPIYILSSYFILLNTINAAVFGLLVFAHVYGVKYAQEYFAKMQIKKQFGTYVSKDMVEKLQKNPKLLKLGGETKNLTLLFCDIRGFTPISEQYKTDPQGLTKLINRFLTPMTDIIMKNEGTIDKYMGDCIMAFWNAPLDIDNHQSKAILSGIEMIEYLKKLNQELAEDGLLPINVGVGINSGSAVVGNMGSNQRFDYSVLGDCVNLASRLEGQSKDYGVKIVIGQDTVNNSKGNYIELDLLAVKGKIEPVKIYTILKEMPNDTELWSHNKFLELYRKGSFDRAATMIRECKDMANLIELEDYYNIMLTRIDYLELNIPDMWDGVYRATSK